MTKRSSAGTSQTRRRFMQVAGAASAAAALPSGFTNSAQAQAGKILRVRLGSDISVLDPSHIFQIENQTVSGHIFNGLVKYDQATNKIVPDAASEWNVSSDGTVFTFKLRPGINFQKNYGPLTSADVKYSLDRVLDPKGGSKYTGQLAGLKSVDTPDPQTVVITLEKPNSGFLHKVTAFNQGWIVPKKAVEERGEKFKLDPVGSGPFVFEKWTAGT